MTKLEKNNIPALLQEIPDSPSHLYMEGVLPSPETKFLTVVGSRRMTRYGREACEYLIKNLSGYPIAIVSGLALGIDGVAHRAAIDAGLPTVAFPGSGLDPSVLYPRAHVRLSEDIIQAGGAIISEMEPLEHATPYSFPKRNRLMAGISHATLIIEAGEKSGTLITAKLATDYNRELLVLSHSIFSESGAGGHIFIRLGARPVRSTSDILDSLNIETRTSTATVHASPEELEILELLTEPMPRDELIRALGLPVGDANIAISSLELKGFIIESLGEIRKNI